MPLTRTSAERSMQIVQDCGQSLFGEIEALQQELTSEELKGTSGNSKNSILVKNYLGWN